MSGHGGVGAPENGPRTVQLIGVRRWGEENTPVVIDGRKACGTWSDHRRNGCIGIETGSGGAYSLLHLTKQDALRLSDLLRALASIEPDPLRVAPEDGAR